LYVGPSGHIIHVCTLRCGQLCGLRVLHLRPACQLACLRRFGGQPERGGPKPMSLKWPGILYVGPSGHIIHVCTLRCGLHTIFLLFYSCVGVVARLLGKRLAVLREVKTLAVLKGVGANLS